MLLRITTDNYGLFVVCRRWSQMPIRRIKISKLKKEFFNDWVLDTINDYSKRYNVFYGGG